MGLERVGISTLPGNDLGQSEKPSAAECAAFGAISETDADLQAVVEAWPGLSPEARAEVSAIVAREGGRGRD